MPTQTRLNAKTMGELAELRFMAKAVELGYQVLRPWGDNSPFDLVLICTSRPVRVQVKCTAKLQTCGAYRVHASHGLSKRPYSIHQIDFLAACVLPVDAWYIVPVSRLLAAPHIYMRPHLEQTTSSWELYRDAWHLLSQSQNVD